MFSTLDLFAVGLGFDISGAILLARGLLVSPELIAKVSASLWGSNPSDAVDRCQNRVDAVFGVGALVAGFGLQLIGYALELGGVDPARGTCELIGAMVLTVLSAGAVGAAWAALRGRLLRRLLVLVARAQQDDEPGWSNARTERLVALGKAAGYPQRDEDRSGEPGAAERYILRVFGVDTSRD